MNIHQEEHRTLRSDSPELATQYQLEQIIQDFNLGGAILSDTRGHLLSTSDAYDLAFYKALAQVSSKLASGSRCRLMFSKLNKHRHIQPNQISSKVFTAGGEQYYLTTIGGTSTYRDIGAFRAIFGIQRILKKSHCNG